MFHTYQKRVVKAIAARLEIDRSNKDQIIELLTSRGFNIRETINGLSFSNHAGFSFVNWDNYIVEEKPGSFTIYNSIEFNKMYEPPTALWL